jgi:hypothetical protein
MSLESLESVRPLITAVSTTLGLIVLSRLLPVFDSMMEHRSSTRRVAYDLCLAAFSVLTLSFFFAGMGFV